MGGRWARRRVLASLSIAIVSILLLSACTNAEEAETDTDQTDSEPDPEASGSAEPDSQEVVAAAQEEGRVVLYTSLDSRVVEQIADAFQEEYDIEVEFFRAGGPEVVTRTLQEADAGRLGADVLDIAEIAGLLEMKNRGLLAEYRSPSAESVPEDFRDPDGTWTASRLRHSVVMWNTDLVTDPPTSLADLGSAEWADQIVMYFGDGGVASRLFAFAHRDGFEVLEPVAANRPTLVESPQRVAEMVELGERPIGFMTQDNTSWQSKRNDRPTDYAFLEEGTPTTMAGVGVAEDAAHPNAARLFVDWWLGEQAQGLLIDAGGYSARTDLAPPEGSLPLADIDNLPEPIEAYVADREAIHDRFEAMFGGDW